MCCGISCSCPSAGVRGLVPPGGALWRRVGYRAPQPACRVCGPLVLTESISVGRGWGTCAVWWVGLERGPTAHRGITLRPSTGRGFTCGHSRDREIRRTTSDVGGNGPDVRWGRRSTTAGWGLCQSTEGPAGSAEVGSGSVCRTAHDGRLLLSDSWFPMRPGAGTLCPLIGVTSAAARAL